MSTASGVVVCAGRIVLRRRGLAGVSLAALAVAGCSSVTTYGVPPRDLGGGRYSLALYYNADASEADIDAKAADVVAAIRAGNGHAGCTFQRSPMVDPWRVKEIRVDVTCE